MDPGTSSELFLQVAEAKLYNPALEVWISVGGWTFSDNGTATQPVYGNIARSAANRQTFANNVLQFMKTYGYNGGYCLWLMHSVSLLSLTNSSGIDIDWEYPGAPDRGGSPDDTENFVLLVQTLRETFDASGNKYGISFTAPTSYWYLRWFDLPGLTQYADWVNVMSYDLHGEWDRCVYAA
jgi:chitinase